MADASPPDSGAGAATIVDVAHKPATARSARAEAWLTASPEVVRRVREGRVEKGDALRVAEVAGLFALKRTAELLPMCHPIGVSGAQVRAHVASESQLRVEAVARTFERTGVEMEVLTAASVAALTLYDMLKRYDPGMEIGPVRLLEKSGGEHGDWRAAGR